MDKCGTCKFFLRGKDPLKGEHYGLCVRYPESIGKHEADGCGEYSHISVTKLSEPVRTTSTNRK